MTTNSLSGEWSKLQSLLRIVNELPESEIVQRIGVLDIGSRIRSALLSAINGDNREMNSWLFSHNPQDQNPLVWIAPVIGDNGIRRYAWMLGIQSNLAQTVNSLFDRASKIAQSDPLLMQRLCPPPLLFVNPIEVSRSSTRISGGIDYDEFAIFQTNYKAKTAEVPDSEQHMVLNATYVVKYREQVLKRAASVTNFQERESLEPEIPLISLIHTEGHNRGHFLGPWPLDKEKKIVLYEALEEFRACIATIRLAEHMNLAENTIDLLATSIFFTRFFGYGFDAYCLPQQRRRTVREITVGLMFFQVLLKSKAIEFDVDKESALRIHPHLIRKTLLQSLSKIHSLEGEANRNTDHLRELARHWYGVAFPDRNYSREALAVYQLLSRKESVDAAKN